MRRWTIGSAGQRRPHAAAQDTASLDRPGNLRRAHVLDHLPRVQACAPGMRLAGVPMQGVHIQGAPSPAAGAVAGNCDWRSSVS